MKLGIMQPYLFPYLGYFQLIGAVDCFVLYDDVNFIKGGWINRNFILGHNGAQRFTLELSGASPNKLINMVGVGNNRPKLLRTFAEAYTKAPYYHHAYPLIEACILYGESNLARFLEHTLNNICSYLGIKTTIMVSSHLKKNNDLKGCEKILAMCKLLGAHTYINAIGGQALYDKNHFATENLDLFFLKMNPVTYPQRYSEFVPNLSIIDLMMYNSREHLAHLLGEYTLV